MKNYTFDWIEFKGSLQSGCQPRRKKKGQQAGYNEGNKTKEFLTS